MFSKREKVILLFWLLSWLIVPVAAQVRPGLFSTLKAASIIIGGGTSITSSSNIALLNAVNAFTAFGLHQWSASSTGINQINVRNSSAGTTNLGRVGATSDTVNTYLEATATTFTATGVQPQAGGALYTDGTGGLSIGTTAAGPIKMYTNGLLRWGINPAGDRTFGTASHIADSNGTPTAAGQPGTLTSGSTDYAIQFAKDGTSTSQVQVTFGHTWTNAPVCVSSASPALAGLTANATTTVVTVQYTATAATSTINILCRGF